MRRLLLAALLLAAPAAAQDKEPFSPVVSVSYKAPVRAVYVAAFNAMESRGVLMRARLLDQGIMSEPRFSNAQPGPEESAVVMLVEMEENGDSTRVVVRAEVVHPDGRPVADGDDRLTRILVAETMISAAMDSALDKLPPGTGGPDPREASDTYGYGRGNPIRVGGARESGAANQRRYLDGLRGPAGQPVRYRRLGSCCGFRSEHAPDGGALDAYEVTYDGIERPVLLYIDVYTPPEGSPPPPDGFVFASATAPS